MAKADPLASVKATWPQLDVDAEAFQRHLSSAVARWPTAAQNAADLYLAFACARGEPRALRALNALATAEIPKALANLAPSATFTEDVRQLVLEKLLVGSAAKGARIADYSGRGSLSSWIRAAAVRTGLNLREGQRPMQTLDADAPAKAGGADPELAAVRGRLRGPLKAALQEALTSLPVDDRNVLRFYFVDGLTVEQIAQLRRTHKSTVSRLITRVRRELRERVEATFRRELGASRSALSSILRVLDRDLDLSIERVLKRR